MQENILIKKGFIMRWVKQAVSYWCDDIKSGKCLGKGVTVAVLDTGLSAHPDLEGRTAGFRDFVGNSMKCSDDSGHGTHVAGILAGSGRVSDGLYAGMAPEASLLVGKVLDREGNGNVENVIAGIRWILEQKDRYGVRIVNISVGTQPDLGEYQKRRFLAAVEELWDSGLVVAVSAGNYGPGAGSVAVPGTSRKVITVGVPDTELPPVQRRRKNVNYSGRGPTSACVCKPDVVAPGAYIKSCNADFERSGKGYYTEKSGTSMATPVVSGALALLLSRDRELTNKQVKLKLRASCLDLRLPRNQQGWGQIWIPGLLSL